MSDVASYLWDGGSVFCDGSGWGVDGSWHGIGGGSTVDWGDRSGYGYGCGFASSYGTRGGSGDAFTVGASEGWGVRQFGYEGLGSGGNADGTGGGDDE